MGRLEDPFGVLSANLDRVEEINGNSASLKRSLWKCSEQRKL